MTSGVINFVFRVTIILVPLWYGKVYKKLFKKLGRVETIMHAVNINQEQSPTELQMYTWIIYALLAISCYGYITYYIVHAPMVYALGYVAIYSSCFACTIHILSLLMVVDRKITSINWHLEYMNNKVPVYLSSSEARLFLQKKIHGKEVANKFVDSACDLRAVTARKIRSFNQIHLLLYSSCNHINNYFSLQILLCVVSVTLQVITMCLHMFKAYDKQAYIYVFVAPLIIYNFVCVFRIACVFHKITSEVGNLRICFNSCTLPDVKRN